MIDPKDDKFNQNIHALNEIRDRMLQAGLIVTHGYSDNPKRVGAEFTPAGQEVVLTISALNEAIGPLAPEQIVRFWKYMVEVAEARKRGQ